MKIDTIFPNPKVMMWAIMFCLAACGSGNKVLTNKEASVVKMPFVEYVAPSAHKDTVISHLSDVPKIAYIRHSEKQLVISGILPPYDSLLKHDFEATTHWARAADTARERKHRLDSTSIRDKVVNDKLDRVLKNQDSNNKETALYKAKADNEKKSSAWMFWCAVVGVLVLQGANLAYAKSIHKRTKPYTL